MNPEENTTAQEGKNPIQVADRLFGTLEYLAENGASNLKDIAASQHLNKSTAHRVVTSLQYMGYVQQLESGQYEPTFRIVELAGQVMDKIDIVRIVHPHLQHLMDECGETVHFVQRIGTDVVYIDKVESDKNNVRMVSRIGSRIPFYRSAVGKALAARMSTEEVQTLWNSCVIERRTPYTITNFDDFLDELKRVREKGYAVDNEENESGIRCVAAALDVPAYPNTYAFSISVPINRMDNDRIRELSGYLLKEQQILNTRLHL